MTRKYVGDFTFTESGAVRHQPNNILNRRQLDCLSALKIMLCLVTTKIFLLAAAPTAAYNLFYYTIR